MSGEVFRRIRRIVSSTKVTNPKRRRVTFSRVLLSQRFGEALRKTRGKREDSGSPWARVRMLPLIDFASSSRRLSSHPDCGRSQEARRQQCERTSMPKPPCDSASKDQKCPPPPQYTAVRPHNLISPGKVLVLRQVEEGLRGGLLPSAGGLCRSPGCVRIRVSTPASTPPPAGTPGLLSLSLLL